MSQNQDQPATPADDPPISLPPQPDGYVVPAMTESRYQASRRLRDEERWGEACVYRDRRIVAHRTAGRRREAKDLSWLDMIAAFPPLPPAEPTPPEPETTPQDPPEVLDRLAAVDFDWARDVVWVYAHIRRTHTTTADAPSLGAAVLLDFARQDVARFLPMVAAVAGRIQSAGQRQPTTEADLPAADPGLADLDRMIRSAQ